MFQQLDDQLPLQAATPAQRRAVIERGAALRTRRRAVVFALPLVGATTAAAVIITVSGPIVDSSTPTGTVAPAASPTRSAPVQRSMGPPNTAEPAFGACVDPLGDSAGEPDLMLVALDRPAFPFVHFHWDGSRLPPVGTVEAMFEATSADGLRSRQLTVVIVDGAATAQFVLDPATGERQPLGPDEVTDTFGADGQLLPAVELGADGVGGAFPGSAVMPLGDAWTWTASISVDGTVVDTVGAQCSP